MKLESFMRSALVFGDNSETVFTVAAGPQIVWLYGTDFHSTTKPRQPTKCVSGLAFGCPQVRVFARVFTLRDLSAYCWPTPLFM